MIVNAVVGILLGFFGHVILERPTQIIFSSSEDVTRLAQYSEGGLLVIIHNVISQVRRKGCRKEHAIADLVLSFFWIGLGTVLAYMLDGWQGKR